MDGAQRRRTPQDAQGPQRERGMEQRREERGGPRRGGACPPAIPANGRGSHPLLGEGIRARAARRRGMGIGGMGRGDKGLAPGGARPRHRPQLAAARGGIRPHRVFRPPP